MSAAVSRRHPDPRVSEHVLAITIDVGCVEMYQALRYVPNPFSEDDLAQLSGATPSAAGFYLAGLARRGVVSQAGLSSDRKPVYGKPRLAVKPVVFDASGKSSSEYERNEAMWLTARTLRAFTATDLHDVVKEHRSVEKRYVHKFIERLQQAGYLIQLEQIEDEPGFALRPSMNTGPLPPRFCEADLVYDLNRKAFFGNAKAHEVAL